MFDKEVLREEEEEQGSGGGGEESVKEPQKDPEESERLARLEKKLDEQGQFFSQFFQQRQQQQRPQQQDPDEARKRFEESFYQNPGETTARIAQHFSQQAAQQVQAEMHPVRVKMARDEGRGLDPDVFDKYKSEIEGFVQQNYEPQHWGNPFVWKQALNNVKSEKFDEVAAWKAEKKKKAADLNAPSRRGYVPGEEQKGLSDDQKAMADFLGMEYDEYESANKAYVADKTAPTTGRDMLKSDWANIITLDSKKQRKRQKAKA